MRRRKAQSQESQKRVPYYNKLKWSGGASFKATVEEVRQSLSVEVSDDLAVAAVRGPLWTMKYLDTWQPDYASWLLYEWREQVMVQSRNLIEAYLNEGGDPNFCWSDGWQRGFAGGLSIRMLIGSHIVGGVCKRFSNEYSRFNYKNAEAVDNATHRVVERVIRSLRDIHAGKTLFLREKERELEFKTNLDLRGILSYRVEKLVLRELKREGKVKRLSAKSSPKQEPAHVFFGKQFKRKTELARKELAKFSEQFKMGPTRTIFLKMLEGSQLEDLLADEGVRYQVAFDLNTDAKVKVDQSIKVRAGQIFAKVKKILNSLNLDELQ